MEKVVRDESPILGQFMRAHRFSRAHQGAIVVHAVIAPAYPTRFGAWGGDCLAFAARGKEKMPIVPSRVQPLTE